MCAVNYSTTFFPQHNAREGSSMKWLFSVSVIFHMSAMIVPDSPPLLTVTSAVHTQASRPQNGQHIRCPGTWDVWLLMGNQCQSHELLNSTGHMGPRSTVHELLRRQAAQQHYICQFHTQHASSLTCVNVTKTPSAAQKQIRLNVKKKKGKEPLEPLQWNITHYSIMNYCNMTVSLWIHSL